jgi:MerR family copper efflux transcriptional regulator
MFTVGQVARAAGVSAKAVRLYEARGLLPVAARNTAGYRLFEASDVDTVRFIRRVRSLGLGLDAAAEILATHRSGQAPCGRTGQLLEHRIAEIDHTLRELREPLVAACRTDHTEADRADSVSDEAGGVCPMIEDVTTARVGVKSFQVKVRRATPGRGGRCRRGSGEPAQWGDRRGR